MNVGELFLNLGVKGTEKTVGALTDVKKGLSETASMSLEAKAGIVGAIYAFEQLMAASGRAGTDLSNFNAVTGVSVQMLQQYQYAGRQVGISNETVAGSFKTLQMAMEGAAIGKAPPAGMAQLAKTVGGIKEDYKELAAHPEKLLQYAQKYAQLEKNIPLRNQVLKSFGLDDSMVAGLAKNAFRPDVMSKAPTYSDGEVAKLDKARAAWANLGNSIEMAIGHFNAKHGNEMVNDISKITGQVIKMVESFLKLAEVLHLFEHISEVFEGWGKIFEGVTHEVKAVTGDKQGVMHGLLSEAKSIGSGAYDAAKGALMTVGDLLPKTSLAPDMVSPKAPMTLGSTRNQNNNVNVTNNFSHPGVDPKKTESSSKKAIRDAFRQLNQGGAT